MAKRHVIDVLRRARQPLTVTEIAIRSGQSVRSISKNCTSLAKKKYVIRRMITLHRKYDSTPRRAYVYALNPYFYDVKRLDLNLRDVD